MRAGIEPRTARWMAIRIGIVAAAFAVGFVVVTARAVQLQVLQGDRLGGLARDQYLRELTQKPRRGTITDRNGAVLAGNAEADSIFVDPREFPGLQPVEFRHVPHQSALDQLRREFLAAGDVHRARRAPMRNPGAHLRRAIRIRAQPDRLRRARLRPKLRAALGKLPRGVKHLAAPGLVAERS